MRFALLRPLCALLLCCLACPDEAWARAQDAAPAARPPSRRVLNQARQHYDVGTRFYDVGNYLAARLEFEEAYRLAHLPDLLFNLGRVAEKLGQPQVAVQYLETYLRERPDAPDSGEVRGHIRRLSGQAAPPLPLSSPPSLRGPLLLTGAGAVLAVLAIGLGGGAAAAARSVDEAERRAAPPAELAALEGRQRDLTTAAIVLGVKAALALGAGLGWLGGTVRHRRDRPRAALYVVPLGPGLALGGSF